MSTTAEELRELLPSAEPKPAPSLLPDLPAPPGVATTNAPAPGQELIPGATSQVQPRETTRGQMDELLSANSPYLQRARGSAQRYSASRGLQNSSIAGQAGEQAAITAALPIASETAGAYERRALLGEQGNISSRLQQESAAQRLIEQAAAGDITSRQMLEQFGFDTKLTAQENVSRLQQLAAQGDLDAKARLEAFQNQSRLLTQQTTATAGLQERDLANRQWMAQFDATTQQNLQAVDLATRERMQQSGFTQEQIVQQAAIAAREREQQVEVANQQWLAQFDATTREKLQGLEADVRLGLQRLDLETQNRIANMEVAAGSRSDASRMMVSMELAYSTMLQTIMNNPDIPAEERQAYMDHANTVRETNVSWVEQLFAIDLEW